MEKRLSDKIKIVEQGDNSDIVYIAPDGTPKSLRFNASGVYANSTLALDATNTIEMPLSYSSAFQTATLASTFLTTQTVPTNFVGLGSTAITGGSATINSTGCMINIGSIYFANVSGYSFTTSVSGLNTTVSIKTA